MSNTQDFDRDVMPPSAEASDQELRDVITLIARASHDIADLVSLGDLAPAYQSRPQDGAAAGARKILIEHLAKTRVRDIVCAGIAEPITIDANGLFTVTIDPLEGLADAGANLPFGTIFSVTCTTTQGTVRTRAAGFIHYGPQTNLVLSLGAGVHIFNLDRTTRTYRLTAENIRLPDTTREWSVDVTKRARWPSSIRALIDEELGEADASESAYASVRWTGSLTADAYRVLRNGGVYLCPIDDQHGRAASAPSLVHAALPIAFVIEQAGGRATTGREPLVERTAADGSERTALIFGSPGIVDRVERLHALPESQFDTSPLFQSRGLFRI